MQRVNYEDSGLNVDTRGTTAGVVSVQSSNDGPVTLSVPKGTLHSLNLVSSSLQMNALSYGTATSIPIIAGSPSVYMLHHESGNMNFQLGPGSPGQMLIIIKITTGTGDIGFVYNAVAGANTNINGGTVSLANILDDVAGIVIGVYQPHLGWFVRQAS